MAGVLQLGVARDVGLLALQRGVDGARGVAPGRHDDDIHVHEAVVDGAAQPLERPAAANVVGGLDRVAVLQVAARRDLIAAGHLREQRLVPGVHLAVQIDVAGRWQHHVGQAPGQRGDDLQRRLGGRGHVGVEVIEERRPGDADAQALDRTGHRRHVVLSRVGDTRDVGPIVAGQHREHQCRVTYSCGSSARSDRATTPAG